MEILHQINTKTVECGKSKIESDTETKYLGAHSVITVRVHEFMSELTHLYNYAVYTLYAQASRRPGRILLP